MPRLQILPVTLLALSLIIVPACYVVLTRMPGSYPKTLKEQSPDIVFGIVLAVTARNFDTRLDVPCAMSLSSIAQQKYTHWHLIIIGDGLDEKQINILHAMMQKLFKSSNRILFQNMDKKWREASEYGHPNVWRFAGINALNMGLRIAYNLTTVTHIARLDDDDYWAHDHLMNLAAAFTQYPNASFAHTQVWGFGHLPFPGLAIDKALRNQTVVVYPPHPCALCHASAAWKRNLHVFYHQEWEQKVYPRHKENCCGNPTCPNGTILPADADLWERVRGMVRDKLIISVVSQTPDVYYSNQSHKLCFPRLRNASSTCQTLMHYVDFSPTSGCLGSSPQDI